MDAQLTPTEIKQVQPLIDTFEAPQTSGMQGAIADIQQTVATLKANALGDATAQLGKQTGNPPTYLLVSVFQPDFTD